MDFKDLLTNQELDLNKVMVMRHRPKQTELRRILPWLAAEKQDVFNAYQQTQSPVVEQALMKAEVVASFIAQDGEKALFVGLFERGSWKSVTQQELCAIPAAAEVEQLLSPGLSSRTTRLWFELKPLDVHREWKGRLVVRWPPGRLWWRWAKSNDFPIHAIHEDSVLAAQMPPWTGIALSWKELALLPTKWKNSLSQWRGIYYIFDIKLGKGYVGSASGQDNILGRWVNYAASGHGGNKRLRECDPNNFLFSILQRTSPDLEREEICAIEGTWKDRLHTRVYGLNEN